MSTIDHQMCGTGADAGSPALRYRIAQALADYLEQHSQRDVATTLGIASSTVCRRGASIEQWPAADVLALAHHDEALRHAMHAYLYGTREPDADRRVELIAIDAMHNAGEYIEAIATALEDGRIDQVEARQIARMLAEHRATISALIDRAVMQAGGVA